MDAGNHGLTPQPRASSIPVAAIVAGPPSQTYSDEAVIEVMVVIGEVIVIVVMAVPVLAMPIVAVPIVPVPCRAAMPAATAPSTGTGDVSATYSASAKVAGAHVPSGEMCSAAHVAHASAHVAHASAHVAHAAAHVAHASAHVAHASAPMASGIRLIYQDRCKQQAACNGSDCGYMLSHDCISLDTQTAWSRPPTLMPSLTLMRGGSLRSVASPQ